MKTMKAIKAIVVSCLFFAVTQSAVAEQTVRLTNGEWQPYMSEHVPHLGMGSHIVTEAFALVDVQVEYGFVPWKRAFDVAKKGTWDGTVGWSYNDERGQSFFFTDPVFPSIFGFFHLKDSTFDWNAMEDLKDTKIGATMEYSYGDDFDTAFTHHPNLVDSTDQHLLLTKANPDSERLSELCNQGLQQLKESGRYDEIIADALAGKYAKPK